MPSLKYSPENYTWGYELELGDVPRDKKIPSSLGAWEYSEIDIVNLHDPYKYVACDPLGIDPPVGGEINTVPTHTTEEQLKIIENTLGLFKHPTACTRTTGHIHVRVPGLRDDINALKRLTSCIMKYQAEIVRLCCFFTDADWMNNVPGSRAYLKYDGGRLMPSYMGQNILEKAKDFNSFISLQCCGKDGVSRGRPFRYAINTYCLKHIDTIEFRCFRNTLDLDVIRRRMSFVKEFLYRVLCTDKDPGNMLLKKEYRFEPVIFDENEYRGWMATKWDKSRGKKLRKLLSVS